MVPVGSTATASSGTEEWPDVCVLDSSKVRYQDHRNTTRHLRSVYETHLKKSELFKEAIERAKESIFKYNIPDFNPNFKPAQPVTKRQRSLEENKPNVKRHKTIGETPRKSSAGVAKDFIIIGVLDENNLGGMIPKAQWKWVEAELTKVALKVILQNPGPPPAYLDLGWHQDQIKIIACGDERSVQLYKKAISKVGEVYKNAKLVVVDKKDIPPRLRARVWLPSTVEDPVEIMELIRVCNPDIPTQEWKYVKTLSNKNSAEESKEQNRATMQILLLLTENSSAPLEKCDWQLRYGFVRVQLHIYKTDIEFLNTKESTEPMSELEPLSETEPMSEDDHPTEEEYASSGSEMGGRRGD
ncbi:uncharacterized protein LOC129237186 isoform X3 [Anastrepha obliqua]|uniref:uncharacterized protein LOC129237186 isoform X3 n=1 Tax=Anastrepha obliqua TaxID=95512 RepID=UPI00240A2F6E|nr:uncharacterized protein LOC129237186 isoform X3 [Anastrepha obliqua]